MSIKILATADLHLGRSSSGIVGGVEELSTKLTWNRIVEWCVRNEVDVLALCGDIVDRDNRYFEAIGPLQAGFERLGKAGVKVYVVTGNHDFDVLSRIAGNNKFEFVHLLGFNGQWEMKTFEKNEEKVQFAGWSFPSQYVTQDPTSTFNRTGIDPNFPVIGLLHGDVENMESSYGPVSLNNLVNAPVHLWILGHIHKPQRLRDYSPQVWYPGSPQAMSAKEPGMHGPLYLVVEGHEMEVSRVPLSPVRYEDLPIDISHTTDEVSMREEITSALIKDADSRRAELGEVAYLVYDIWITGYHSNIAQVDDWIKYITDFEQETSWGTTIQVRKVNSALQPAIQNLEELAKQASPAGILADTILAIKNDRSTPFLEGLIEQWKRKFENINNCNTYQPLRSAGRLKGKEAKRYLSAECNRLLSELIAEQEN